MKKSLQQGEGPIYMDGYRWTCGLCRGMGLVDTKDDAIDDCPKCTDVRKHGVAYEVVRREVTLIHRDRLASPGVGASRYVYEVYEFLPAPVFPAAKVRVVTVEPDVREARAALWNAEADAYWGHSA